MNTTYWPLQSYLELGALPSAVPSARLHARLVVGEWGLEAIADTVELIVSELVTNGVKASQKLEHRPPVWLGLSSDGHQVLVAAWDGNDEPVRASVVSGDELPDPDAENGRGLFLVDSLSTNWGVIWLEGGHGKVVWSVVAEPEADDIRLVGAGQPARVSLPRRVVHMSSSVRPAQSLSDLAVLQRVREGLRRLE